MKWLLRPVYVLFLLWYRFRYRKLSVCIVDDIPDQVTPGYLYLVGDVDEYWAATMLCPCGCGDTITLNLIGSRPVWRPMTSKSGMVSLHPSVHRNIFVEVIIGSEMALYFGLMDNDICSVGCTRHHDQSGTYKCCPNYSNVGHGIGTGKGTSAEEWIADAVRFWKKYMV